MDYQPDTNTPYTGQASPKMALASMILGIIAVITSGCIYLAFVCGALSIIFAFLSKGGSYRIPAQGKAGLALGVAGLLLTICIYTAAFLFLLKQYGGMEGLIQEYMELYHADTIEELYENMGIY